MTTRFQHELRRREPTHTKVMLRLERRIQARGLRSYRGYTNYRLCASLNFDDERIGINLWGDLRRLPCPAN